ncbi:PepSY-associated TM helix domain-containing protein [Candidatus Nitrospira bockiana]
MASIAPRKLLLVLHRWLGLLVSAVVIVIGLTGAALVFETEIDEALHPELWRVVPGGVPLSLDALLDAVHAAYPSERLEWIELHAAPDHSVILHTVGGRQIFVDPYSAAVLGERKYENTFFGTMFSLHRTLLAGEAGRIVVGVATLGALFLLVTGIFLWWPRTPARSKPSLNVRWKEGTRRLIYDLHNVLGFYASWYLIVIALTGLVWSFPVVNEAIFWLTQSPPPPWKSEGCSQAVPGARPLSVDEALRRADAVLPGAQVTELMFPQKPDDPYAITKRFPRRGNPNAQSHLCVDRYSGEILQVARYEDLPLGATIRLLVYPIHVGAIYGLPTQVLAFIVSLVIPISAATGFLLWWRKRKPSPGLGR